MSVNSEHDPLNEGISPSSAFEMLNKMMLEGVTVGGDYPVDPDGGDPAELTSPDKPPEIEGAEAELPLGAEPLKWAGNIAMTSGH